MKLKEQLSSWLSLKMSVLMLILSKFVKQLKADLLEIDSRCLILKLRY